MSESAQFILSLSVLFAATIGAIRFRKMDPSYYPFVYYVCSALVIEIVVYILIQKKMFQTIGFLKNAYAFIEFCLLTWLFNNWGLFKRQKNLFLAILVFFFVLWLSTLFIRGYAKSNLTFYIVYSFVLIFFSISSFNRMVVNDRKNIFTNARFWICLGIIIFYTYFIVSNTARLSVLKPKVSQHFIDSLFEINIYSNLLVNLLYVMAVIWIPRKKNISTLF